MHASHAYFRHVIEVNNVVFETSSNDDCADIIRSRLDKILLMFYSGFKAKILQILSSADGNLSDHETDRKLCRPSSEYRVNSSSMPSNMLIFQIIIYFALNDSSEIINSVRYKHSISSFDFHSALNILTKMAKCNYCSNPISTSNPFTPFWTP